MPPNVSKPISPWRGIDRSNRINHMFQHFFDIRRVDINNNGQPIAIKRAIKTLINIDAPESFVS